MSINFINTGINTKPNNGQLNYIPSNVDQVIPEGYTSGGIVSGDANLLPENIKSGVTIFGVTGSYEGEKESDLTHTKLTYIETNGTQYIDTGVPATNEIAIEVSFEPSEYKDNVIFGVRTNASEDAKNYELYLTSSTTFNYRFGSSVKPINTNGATKYLVKMSKEGITLNENTIAYSYTLNDIGLNMYLMAMKQSNGVDSRTYKGKVYYCKMWRNNVLIRDFIPCLDSNGVACLYDKVTKAFYYNIGTGDFIKGEEVVNNDQ